MAIPIPADAFDCQCKTVLIDPTQRCSGPLPMDQCSSMISIAFSNGLLTSDAVTFLQNNGFCPVIGDLGSGLRILDFCPAGCFAAQTQILTSVPRDGKAGYTPASEITSQDTLMSMADEASLSEVTMAPSTIKRLVHGPEEPPLYVFGLANGSTLRVTQHHPMVLHNGKIIEANQVGRHMSFIGVDGKRVAITSITREPATGEVFNFQTAGDTQLSHVIVAEGVLVGDLKLQNELEAEPGAIELRR
ncbi:MAG TPA: Hint domain-containing protein [Kofleriaceae bacterium]|nr:Hint domain-containing protein [Kofleriaceae bacterium]